MPRKRNSIGEQFSTRIVRMLESPAYRALSLSGHRVLSRIEIELMHHGGGDNGKLPVTYNDFVDYGVHRAAIGSAIRECVALGFLEITEIGQAGNADFRKPNKFRLTYAYATNIRPTHDWQRIETDEQAAMLARTARKEKQKTSAGKRTSTGAGNRHRNSKSPVPETSTTGQGTETNPTFYILGRGT
jgi:hypothetical protein